MMKTVLFAISASAFLMLSVTSTPVLAYSGSECEVQDCSKNAKPTNANATKGKAKTKADVKTDAKAEAKTKSLEKVPAQLRDITGFLK